MDLPSIMSYHPASGDAIKFVAPAPKTAGEVDAFLAKYHIIDIRSTTAYSAGHLNGAVNAPTGADGSLAAALAEAGNAGSKPILVVCFSGQTACYTTALLRLAGYRNAQALKWGMSGWDNTTQSWNSNVNDIAQGSSNWNNSAAPTNTKFDAPSLNETGDGATILKSRIAIVAAAGFKKVKGEDVLTAPANYFINNYFNDADYTGFGHFTGTYRINPLSIADDYIYNVDPASKVVTYCYTGQTSAVITAYLNVLGYDASSLLFGMNGLLNSSTYWPSSKGKGNQWSVTAHTKNYPVVTK